MQRQKDKRSDFVHAYEVAAREARDNGSLDEASILEAKAIQLRAHIQEYPHLTMQPTQ